MGKNKAQRTKNNARPANSSRSAELLETSIIGFTNTPTDNGSNPFLTGLSITNNVDYSGIDPTFQVILKKMNKKDATTKYKALQEFGDLCKNSELKVIEMLLPVWPRLFCSLSTDNDHKVREAVQIAHSVLLKQVGKSIAAYLKQFVGPWFVSQFDTYPPAASAATNCFNSTFPKQKSVNAIVHCEEEILKYITDTIIVQTPQTLSTNKRIPQEEMEDKYQRLLISCLQAYDFFIKTVPKTEIIKTNEYHMHILSCNKFWKLAKHNAVPIRCAFFSVICSLILFALDLMTEQKKVVTTVINSLDETEPALLTIIWETLLAITTKIENWYEIISIEKLVLPKLWKVLKNNAQYSPSVIYPNLLPLLNQLMNSNINRESFYSAFFDNLRLGFLNKDNKPSRSEISAAINSVFECFRYAIVTNVNDEQLCKNLTKTQLFPMIEIFASETGVSKTIFFCEINNLIRYWDRNKEEITIYNTLIAMFWNNLDNFLNTQLDTITNEFESNTIMKENVVVEILSYFKNESKVKRNLKVTFSDSIDEDDRLSQLGPVNNPIELSSNELQKVVSSVCKNYVSKIIKYPQKYRIEKFVQIIENHNSADLLLSLAETYTNGGNLFDFYEDFINKLIPLEMNNEDAIIKFIFLILSYVADSEKEIIMNSLLKLNFNENQLSVALEYALSDTYRENPVIQKWCNQTTIIQLIISKAKEICLTLQWTDTDKTLFLQIFKPCNGNEVILSQEVIHEISILLSQTIEEFSINDLKARSELGTFLNQLLVLSWEHNIGTVELLKSLFWLDLRLCIENYPDIGNSNLYISQQTWTGGLFKLSHQLTEIDFEYLIKYFASNIWKRLFNMNDLEIRQPIIILLTNFFNVIIKSNENVSKNYLITCMTELDIKNWIKDISSLIIYGEIITGNLLIPDFNLAGFFCNETFEIDLADEKYIDNMDDCLKWTTVNIKVLINILSINPDFPELIDVVMNLFYIITLGNIYSKRYKSSKNCNKVDYYFNIIEYEMQSLKKYVKDEKHVEIICSVVRNSFKYGGVYPYLLKFYFNYFLPNYNIEEKIESIRGTLLSDDYNDTFIIQTAQVLNIYNFVSKDVMTNFSEIFTKIFFSRQHFIKNQDTAFLKAIFDIIIECQKHEPLKLLLDCEMDPNSWESLCLSLEVINFFIHCIKISPEYLNIHQWDIIEICLSTWILTLEKSQNMLQDFKMKTLIVNIARLYCSFQEFLNYYESQKPPEIPPSLLDEWKNVFASDVQIGIYKIWKKIAEIYLEEKYLCVTCTIPLDFLGQALRLSQEMSIDVNNPDTINFLLKLMQSPVLSLQLSTYTLLNYALDAFVNYDKDLIQMEDYDEKLLSLYKFENILKTTQAIVNTILADFKLCDVISCTIEPYTDSYTYTIGYLFTWNIILNFCGKVHTDLRYQYGEMLKDEYFPCLLNNIFRLMPVEVLQDGKLKFSKLNSLFNNKPSFNFFETWNEWRLDNIVCWLYSDCLRYLPVLVRQWWSTTDSKVSMTVDKITSIFVSPTLCHEELYDNRLNELENMQIKVHHSSREVVAVYQMDDTKSELKIILPTNYPLGTVTVEPGLHAGGTVNWRNCHKQLSIFLTHQNGSIWDGLKLWKANLDKRFAGAEECCICFSIFHINNYDIPRLTCQTCRKKFHKLCLYKWFSTSHNSTCPICRNVF